TVPASQLTCDPQGQSNSGIVNTATLTHQFGEIPGRACVDITPPTVDIDKTVTSTDQLADGTWQIVYEIEVENSSTLVATYSLSDALSFGGDITVTGATWALQGADPAVGGTFSGTTATLAT